MISLGCKHPVLKHVMSFRTQVNMILDSPERTKDEIEGLPEVRILEVSLPVLENTQISNKVKTTNAKDGFYS